MPPLDSSVKIQADFEIEADHPILLEPEELREDLRRALDLTPGASPIHVRLFQSPEDYRVFMNRHYPNFPNRRAYFVEEDYQLAVYTQCSEKLHVDLRHELTHAYVHSVTPRIPLWLDEGIAEYFEVDRELKGLNRPHLNQLTAERMQGRWSPNLRRLEQLREADDMTQLDYAEAWAWVHWLLQTSPKRAHLLQGYLGQLRAGDATSPLSEELYRQVPAADQQLLEHLELARNLH